MARSRIENGEEEHDVGETLRNAATKLSEDLNRTATDARQAAEELGEALRHSARHTADKARARATAATYRVQQGVREKPITWLAAAAGVGAVLGLLLAARR